MTGVQLSDSVSSTHFFKITASQTLVPQTSSITKPFVFVGAEFLYKWNAISVVWPTLLVHRRVTSNNCSESGSVLTVAQMFWDQWTGFQGIHKRALLGLYRTDIYCDGDYPFNALVHFDWVTEGHLASKNLPQQSWKPEDSHLGPWGSLPNLESSPERMRLVQQKTKSVISFMNCEANVNVTICKAQ